MPRGWTTAWDLGPGATPPPGAAPRPAGPPTSGSPPDDRSAGGGARPGPSGRPGPGQAAAGPDLGGGAAAPAAAALHPLVAATLAGAFEERGWERAGAAYDAALGALRALPDPRDAMHALAQARGAAADCGGFAEALRAAGARLGPGTVRVPMEQWGAQEGRRAAARRKREERLRLSQERRPASGGPSPAARQTGSGSQPASQPLTQEVLTQEVLTQEVLTQEVLTPRSRSGSVAPTQVARHVTFADSVGGARECPGVFGEGCGGRLVFRGPKHQAAGATFLCERYPKCRYHWNAPVQHSSGPLELALELATAKTFRLTPANRHHKAGELVDALLKRIVRTLVRPEHNVVPASDLADEAVEYELRDYERVKTFLQSKEREGEFRLLEANALPYHTLKHIRALPSKLADDGTVERRFLRIPATLRAALLPFQTEGVKFGIRRQGNVLIADEMGLGKTIEAVALWSCYADEGRLLVVTPASLRLTWAEEIERWAPTVSPKDIAVIFSSKDALDGVLGKDGSAPRITIVSYNMLSILKDRMLEVDWAFVICDESHRLKVADSQIAVATSAVLRKVKRKVLLTGTPSLNKPYDLYLQADAVSRELLGPNRGTFAKQYCEMRWHTSRHGHSFQQASGGRRLHELHLLLESCIMLRRLKKDVMDQLPEKRRQVIRLEVVSKKAKGKPPPPSASQVERMSAVAQYQATGQLKLEAVCEWLKLLLEGTRRNHKVLVFGHHHEFMDHVQAHVVEEGGYGFVRIDGRTDAHLRQEYSHRFQHRDECRVALLSIQAAGVGMNFCHASSVVFAEMPITVADLEQCEARAHRKGLRNSVNVYFLLARETRDERLWTRLGRSLNKLKALHDGEHFEGGIKIDGMQDDGFLVLPTARIPAQPEAGQRERALLEEESDGDNGDGELFKTATGFSKDLWFEVSPHTGRLHLHAAGDGARLMGVNIHPDDIFFTNGDFRHLPSPLSERLNFNAALKFLEEWGALRPYDRLKLGGQVMQSPLELALAKLPAEQKVLSKRRFTPLEELAAPLPEGAGYRAVSLAFNASTTYEYQMPWRAGQWLCGLCMAPLDCLGQGEHLRLRSKAELFCTKQCFQKYASCNSSATVRQEMKTIEKGVCQECGLDCLGLVQRLQAFKASRLVPQKEVLEKRKALLQRLAPNFFATKKAYGHAKRLLEQPLEGLAWHIDHIVPVFKGGGQLGLENYRTLCVICHAAVTRQQALERTKARNLFKKARASQASKERGRRQSFLSELSSDEEAGPSSAPAKSKETKKKRKMSFLSELSTEPSTSAPSAALEANEQKKRKKKPRRKSFLSSFSTDPPTSAPTVSMEANENEPPQSKQKKPRRKSFLSSEPSSGPSSVPAKAKGVRRKSAASRAQAESPVEPAPPEGAAPASAICFD